MKANYSHARMREMRSTQSFLAQQPAISPATLNVKLRNKSVFTQTEFETLCRCLHIRPQEIAEYFLPIRLNIEKQEGPQKD